MNWLSLNSFDFNQIPVKLSIFICGDSLNFQKIFSFKSQHHIFLIYSMQIKQILIWNQAHCSFEASCLILCIFNEIFTKINNKFLNFYYFCTFIEGNAQIHMYFRSKVSVISGFPFTTSNRKLNFPTKWQTNQTDVRCTSKSVVIEITRCKNVTIKMCEMFDDWNIITHLFISEWNLTVSSWLSTFQLVGDFPLWNVVYSKLFWDNCAS